MVNTPEPPVIHRYLTGEATSTERHRVDRWREQNESDFQQWSRLWQQSEEQDSTPDFNIESGWSDLSHQLKLDQTARKRRIPTTAWILVAAACLVAAAVFWRRGDNWTTIPATTKIAEIALSDGSRITLAAGSNMSYRISQQRRSIRLNGRAFFNVTPAQQPFRVTTKEAQIEVIGTGFDVWSRGGTTEVAVKNGVVRVRSGSGEARRLEANDKVICDQHEFRGATTKSPSQNVASWRGGWLFLDRQPLARIIAELEAQHQIQIRLGVGVATQQSVSGQFDATDLTGILEALCLTLNLELFHENNRFRLEVPPTP